MSLRSRAKGNSLFREMKSIVGQHKRGSEKFRKIQEELLAKQRLLQARRASAGQAFINSLGAKVKALTERAETYKTNLQNLRDRAAAIRVEPLFKKTQQRVMKWKQRRKKALQSVGRVATNAAKVARKGTKVFGIKIRW